MKAYRLMAPHRAELTEVPRPPSPGAGEVLVKIAGCGLCHSDLAFIDMENPAALNGRGTPFTLGHEIAGCVAEVGTGVSGLKEGDAVCVYPLWGGCGSCAMCLAGQENYCAFAVMIGPGVGLDGGLSEYILVPNARHVLPIGTLDPVAAGPLTDAALTSYAGIKPNLSALQPGDHAVVIGVGGVGLSAIQILRALTGARITGIDLRDSRLVLAREQGADTTFLSNAETAERVRELTNGVGAKLVVDCIGTTASMEMGLKMLMRRGRFVLIGAIGGTIPFGLMQMPLGAHLMTTINGGTSDLREVIALAQLGRLPPLVDKYKLSEVVKGYTDMEAGRLRGRAVCIPD